MSVEEHYSSDLGGQSLGIEMPAKYAVWLAIVERSLLPLGFRHSIRTPGIKNEDLMGNPSRLCKQVLAFIGEEQAVEMRCEESSDGSIGKRQPQGVGPDHRHLRNQGSQGMKRPRALINRESGSGQQSSESARTGADVDELGWWKRPEALLQAAGLCSDLLDLDRDPEVRPVLVRVGDAG